MEFSPNMLDLALLALLAFFALRGMVRGFVREIMGIVGVVAAIFLAVAAYRPLAAFLRRVSALEAGWWDGVALAALALLVFCVGGVKGLLLAYLLLNILLMALPMAMLAAPGSAPPNLVSRSLAAPKVIQAGRYLLDLMPSNWTGELQERAGLLKSKALPRAPGGPPQKPDHANQ
jgi:membrane protein required for colicin V production